MATRLYLHDVAPPSDPGETERSVNLPGTDVFKDYALGVRSLSTTIGAGPEVSIDGSSTSNTVETAEFFTSFSTETLAAQTITAQTWTIAVAVSAGNTAANSFMLPIVYVFREPSTVVGFITDAHTAIGAAWASTQPTGRVATFSGSSVVTSAGDYLVLEFWRHTDGQGMAMGYTQRMSYDGITDVVEDTTVSAASFLDTPQDLVFGEAARRIFTVSG